MLAPRLKAFYDTLKQLPHVNKGESEDQDVRSWGQTGRPGHQKSLDFHTPFRIAHNHFIAFSHRGEMLAPRLMTLYDKCNTFRMSKKAYRKIKTYVTGAKKNDPAIKNPLISTRLSASPTIISLQLPTGAKCKRRGSRLFIIRATVSARQKRRIGRSRLRTLQQRY